MPKINVYLPEDLAEAVRDTAVPVSAICQRALEQAVRRMSTIRKAILGNLDAEALSGRLLPHVTARTVTTIRLGAERAVAAGSANVSSGDLLHGIVAEGAGLALEVLTAIDINPASLVIDPAPEPGGGAEGELRFSTAAGNALELAVNEAIAFGHNYIGTEHVLLGLAAEADGVGGKALRAAGADPKTLRRAVATALAGYAHSRANATGSTTAATAAPAAIASILTAVRAELRPLIERIERLEGRQN